MNFNEAKDLLEKYGQLHILRFFNELTETQKETLLSQIEKVDFSFLNVLKNKEKLSQRGKFEPLCALEKEEIEKNRKEYETIGLAALGKGRVAAVLLAGGQGTRLGFDKPKGMLNVGITKKLSLFEAHIKWLLHIKDLCGAYVPLYIMTSDINHKDTVEFFEENNYFGYDKNFVEFFIQEMLPATDFNGKIFMKSKYEMALSPNGNGGWFLSMIKAGIADKMKAQGIEYLSAFSVDNVLQKINDPAFVGATILSGVDVGSKVVRRANEREKVGVMCLEDGKPSIVEYYEVTEEMANLRDKNGNFAYDFGVILNYLFKFDRLLELNANNMPFHMASKKIPHINENGEEVVPNEPNGYKFETLIIDTIHLMDSCLPYEVEREKEFAPIKNMHGADSLDSARERMKKNGMEV